MPAPKLIAWIVVLSAGTSLLLSKFSGQVAAKASAYGR